MPPKRKRRTPSPKVQGAKTKKARNNENPNAILEIIGESTDRYRVTWHHSLNSEVDLPIWIPKSDVTEATVRLWKKKSASEISVTLGNPDHEVKGGKDCFISTEGEIRAEETNAICIDPGSDRGATSSNVVAPSVQTTKLEPSTQGDDRHTLVVVLKLPKDKLHEVAAKLSGPLPTTASSSGVSNPMASTTSGEKRVASDKKGYEALKLLARKMLGVLRRN